jgi:hypothetical protein
MPHAGAATRAALSEFLDVKLMFDQIFIKE